MKKILVVEDDAAIRNGLEEVLGTEHYQVLTAAERNAGPRAGKEREPRCDHPGSWTAGYQR